MRRLLVFNEIMVADSETKELKGIKKSRNVELSIDGWERLDDFRFMFHRTDGGVTILTTYPASGDIAEETLRAIGF